MSKLDPSKVQGKIREQMDREIRSRREYAKKWLFMSQPEINKFYDQEFLNTKVNEIILEENEKQNTGETFFVSEGMFASMNLCRCGRKRVGTHHIKCLQKAVIKYSESHIESDQKKISNDGFQQQKPNIPQTSNAVHGFFESKYNNLEKSTNYITPKIFMKHKITDSIYNNIIIG
ncbi:CLUMA_CG000248, isoform A [Clunio marinus]|uniref:CLUMA_CG000248, isoform A n=1 Tax=Clunio marinus TaxID=568069 RepID=A0A1J1HFA0_9DIPT|nr:CLUMA_CG000248, isoform A [Clunio marinus]